MRSESIQQVLVLGMRADEEPDHCVDVSCADDSVIVRNPHAPEGQRCVEALELKSGMIRVGLKSPVRGASARLNLPRQPGKSAAERRMKTRNHSVSGSSGSHWPRRFASRMSATKLVNLSVCAAVESSQRWSSSISCKSRPASLSCWSSGICRNRAMAWSTVWLISEIIARRTTRSKLVAGIGVRFGYSRSDSLSGVAIPWL